MSGDAEVETSGDLDLEEDTEGETEYEVSEDAELETSGDLDSEEDREDKEECDIAGDAEVERSGDELILDISEVELIHDSVPLEESENRGVLEITGLSDCVDRTE